METAARDTLGPRFIGFVDDFVSGRLHGWAADTAMPDHGACVIVFAGDRIVGACQADIIRPDLIPLLPGEGRHGFDCLLYDEAFDADGVEVYAVAREAFAALTRGEWASDDGFPRSRHDVMQAFAGHCGRIEGTNKASPALRSIQAGLSEGALRDGADGSGLILVDIRDLLAYHRIHTRVSGIQRVICGLVQALPALGETGNIRFCILGERPGLVHIVDAALLGRLVTMPFGDAVTRQDLDIQIAALEESARPLRVGAEDTFFIAGAFWIYDRLDHHLARMRERGTRVGFLVHDLIPLTHPQLVSSATRRQFGDHAARALPLADVLFTTSHFVAGQARAILINEIGQAPPIRTVPLPHHAMAEAARPASPSVPVDGPFVLCVGTIEIRKNHLLLYRVWAALVRKHGRAAVPRLVVVGRWGWQVEELRQKLAASDNLDGMIVVLSDVDETTLADLYRRCQFTVFPSFAEGWGLPVGESLSAGKLCVASQTTAIPEVGGDACTYFDPHDDLDALAAIERPIIDHDWLVDRERQIAASFRPRTWTDTSLEFWRALQAVHVARSGAERVRGPVFAAGDMIDFTDGSRGGDTTPWRSRMTGAVLSAGWQPREKGGVSPSAMEPAILLRTAWRPGTRVTILLRIAATGIEPPFRIRVAGEGAPADLVVAGARPRWHEVEATADQDGLLRLTFTGRFAAFPGGERGFVLLGLAICGDAGSDRRVAVYREILNSEASRAETGATP